uniref:PHD-type domain-containing protein n=1 Tax=Cuerna arida TaxID=1464854 RepID=A0A1B6EJR7_9HEMI
MKDIKLLKNKNYKSEMLKKFEEQCSSEHDDKKQASPALVDKVTPTSSLGKKSVKTHVSGLCYSCGRGFKANDEAAECDLCDKVYHVTCVVSESGLIDKNDPVFICQPCLKFGDDILKDLGSNF